MGQKIEIQKKYWRVEKLDPCGIQTSVPTSLCFVRNLMSGHLTSRTKLRCYNVDIHKARERSTNLVPVEHQLFTPMPNDYEIDIVFCNILHELVHSRNC